VVQGSLVPGWRQEPACCIFGTTHLSDTTIEDVKHRLSKMKPYIPWSKAYTLGPYFTIEAAPALVRVSLKNGGDPNRGRVVDGPTPLGSVIQQGKSEEIMELLLEYKADCRSVPCLVRVHNTNNP